MSAVDISLLAAPNVVEPLDYETTLAATRDDLIGRLPEIAPVMALESEPLVALLEACTYREINLRARINDAAQAVMLPYATGSDLDNIAANYETTRLEGEGDARFRLRIQQSFHRLAAAGPANAYRQHALGVAADVLDVDVWSDSPGQVTIVVLARQIAAIQSLTADQIAIGRALFGTAPDSASAWTPASTGSQTLQAVLTALNAEDVRPLTDFVVVRAPDVQTFTVSAALEILPGPDPELIRTRRRAAVNAYLSSVTRIGYDVTRAGLIAALVESGVKNVHLISPAADIVRTHGELAVCLDVSLSSDIVNA